MTTTFPTNQDSYTTKADGVTTVRAKDVNDLQDAVTAIEGVLHPDGSGGLNAAVKSLTVLPTGPYVQRANPGQGVFTAGPIISAAAYGTFTGTDDTTTLAAWIAAATSNCVLWLDRDPSGNSWVTNSTLLISGLTNVWVDGPGQIKLKNTSNVPVIRFLNCTGGGVRNIAIDGNGANNTTPGALPNSGVHIGNTATPSTQVNVVGARIQNCNGDGVTVLNSTRCRVEGNYITGCGTTTNGNGPIHFMQGANDGEIMFNVCDSNGYGIYVEANNTTQTQRCRVIGNIVSNCTGTNAALAQGAGIALSGAPYSIVQGNHSYGHTNLRGIVLFPGGTTFPSDWSSFIGNTCSGNGHNGIDITGNFLRCIGNHSEVNAQSGIFLSGDLTPVDSSWCVIANNICRNNGTAGGGGGTLSQAGIVVNTVVGANITDNVISGNVCTDNGTGNQKYGILEWQANASYLRNTYIGNTVRGNATAGMLLLGTTNTVLNNMGYTPSTFDPAGTAFNFPTDISITAGTHGILNTVGPLFLGAANSGAGFLFNVTGQGNKAVLGLTGQFTTYGGIVTAGTGLAGIYASYRNTALVAAVANAINYTPPAAAGAYRLKIHYRPTTTGASTSVGVTVTYKDSTGAISITALPFIRRSTGTVVVPPFLNTGVDDFYADFPFEIDNSATAITVSTTGTFTGTTYNFRADLEQVA